MTPPASTPRRSSIVHGALALGDFAIGTTEFATMSILPLFARDLHVDLPNATVVAVWALVPRDRRRTDAPFLAELDALQLPNARSAARATASPSSGTK